MNANPSGYSPRGPQTDRRFLVAIVIAVLLVGIGGLVVWRLAQSPAPRRPTVPAGGRVGAPSGAPRAPRPAQPALPSAEPVRDELNWKTCDQMTGGYRVVVVEKGSRDQVAMMELLGGQNNRLVLSDIQPPLLENHSYQITVTPLDSFMAPYHQCDPQVFDVVWDRIMEAPEKVTGVRLTPIEKGERMRLDWDQARDPDPGDVVTSYRVIVVEADEEGCEGVEPEAGLPEQVRQDVGERSLEVEKPGCGIALCAFVAALDPRDHNLQGPWSEVEEVFPWRECPRRVRAECGNGICERGEHCGNCLQDCPCPDGTTCVRNRCQKTGAVCGNTICETGEDCATCPQDCGCSAGEECVNGRCTRGVGPTNLRASPPRPDGNIIVTWDAARPATGAVWYYSVDVRGCARGFRVNPPQTSVSLADVPACQGRRELHWTITAYDIRGNVIGERRSLRLALGAQ
jgi:hypothetical protein